MVSDAIVSSRFGVLADTCRPAVATNGLPTKTALEIFLILATLCLRLRNPTSRTSGNQLGISARSESF